MKHPLQNRVLALLWAIAFVLGTAGEGFGLHPCPHHSGGTHTADQVENETHHGHGGAGHQTVADAPHGDHHAPDSGHSGPCTCGAACQAGTGIALPGLELSQTATEITEAPAPAIVGTELLLVERPPYFLPLALAPPA